MPDAFKGYFTLDDKGNHVSLKTREEIKILQDNFYKKIKIYARKNEKTPID